MPKVNAPGTNVSIDTSNPVKSVIEFLKGSGGFALLFGMLAFGAVMYQRVASTLSPDASSGGSATITFGRGD